MDASSVQWKGDYKIETSYFAQDGIKFNGKWWMVTAVEVPWNQPPPDEAYWVEIPPESCPPEPQLPPIDFASIEWRGPYAIETSYYRGQGVDFNGKVWVATAASVPWNQPPPDETLWAEVPAEFHPIIETVSHASVETPLEQISTPTQTEQQGSNLACATVGGITVVIDKSAKRIVSVQISPSTFDGTSDISFWNQFL